MAIAILVGRDATERKSFARWFSELKQVLLDLDSSLDIRIYPDLGDANEIECALVWRHPLGELNQFTHLKCIISLGAGVDHIMADPHLPPNVPIVRIVDPYMANEIVQYVVVTVLNYVKRMDKWIADQKKCLWDRKPPFNYIDKTIGVMGLGFLGKKAARMLCDLGLKVIGWSQSPKKLAGVKDYVGQAQFHEFLSHAEILVCMLPLTKKTENILNKKTFSYLPKGAFLINLARGQHLIDNDLIEALDRDQLSGACLDVFRKEPLPADHPFWKHPKVRVTPHIASVTNPSTVAVQIYDNIKRALSGKTLLNQIDVTKQY